MTTQINLDASILDDSVQDNIRTEKVTTNQVLISFGRNVRTKEVQNREIDWDEFINNFIFKPNEHIVEYDNRKRDDKTFKFFSLAFFLNNLAHSRNSNAGALIKGPFNKSPTSCTFDEFSSPCANSAAIVRQSINTLAAGSLIKGKSSASIVTGIE